VIKINVYKDGGAWYAAQWIDGEYDGCDALDVDDDASDAEAIACAGTMPLSVSGVREIKRVVDVDHWGFIGQKIVRL
jgi:hypothetical protein